MDEQNFEMPNLALREDITSEIFRHLDQKSLLNCRLVCSDWNSTVISSAKFMRRFKFDMTEISPFLSSQISTGIRCLRFREPLSGSLEEIENLFISIDNTLEEATFDFHQCHPISILAPSVNTERRATMFQFMLSNCTSLRELSILSPHIREFGLGYNDIETATLPSMWSIRRLRINVHGIWSSGTETYFSLKSFLMRLPKLSQIDFLHEESDLLQENLVNILGSHMVKFRGSLKIISFDNLLWDPSRFAMLNLILLARKHGVTLKMDNNCAVNLNDCLQFISRSNDFPLIQENCQPIVAGDFTLRPDRIDETRRLGFCTNLKTLHLHFGRPPLNGEFEIFDKLRNLERLAFKKSDDEDEINWDENSTVDLSTFSPVSSSLLFLRVDVPIFDFTAFASFPIIFPVLGRLELNTLGSLPADIFCLLSKLEELESLFISECKLADSMLTQPCHNTWSECETSGYLVPAIAAFKSLKDLTIVRCRELTNDALINGIVYNNTLEVLLIMDFGNKINQIGFNAIVKAGRLKQEPHFGGNLARFNNVKY